MLAIQRRLDMRHHSCDIPKVISHIPIDTEQLYKVYLMSVCTEPN